MLKDNEMRAATDPARWVRDEEMPPFVREQIQKRAYELYMQRGATPGHELEDWIKAESDILSESPTQQAA